jgi:hypothetical protein
MGGGMGTGWGPADSCAYASDTHDKQKNARQAAARTCDRNLVCLEPDMLFAIDILKVPSFGARIMSLAAAGIQGLSPASHQNHNM